jgi:hypothetical protein
MEIAAQTGHNETFLAVTIPSAEEKPYSIERLAKVLGSTIKHDDANKVITFLTMLLTYTTEDQINLGFLADSSTGKSYIPIEIATGYFPKEDILLTGYASNQSYFHDAQGETVKLPNGKTAFRIDLQKKILVWLDQPHTKLLERLRPILSHDQKEILIQIVDRTKFQSHRTKHMLLVGYPTVMFCTASPFMSQQEKTRLLLLSPEQTQEKIREGVKLRINKEANRKEFRQQIETDAERIALIKRVELVKKANVDQVIIPSEFLDGIDEKFERIHDSVLQARHQRDISRLLGLIKGHALLNYIYRDKRRNKDETVDIVATEEDIDAGFKLYDTVRVANEIGIPPDLYCVFKYLKKYMKEQDKETFTTNDYMRFALEVLKRRIPYDAARETLSSLENIGYLEQTENLFDKRIKLYKISDLASEEENCSHQDKLEV